MDLVVDSGILAKQAMIMTGMLSLINDSNCIPLGGGAFFSGTLAGIFFSCNSLIETQDKPGCLSQSILIAVLVANVKMLRIIYHPVRDLSRWEAYD